MRRNERCSSARDDRRAAPYAKRECRLIAAAPGVRSGPAHGQAGRTLVGASRGSVLHRGQRS